VLLHRATDIGELTRRVSGIPVTCVERAVVDAWGSSRGQARPALRAAAISAVRRRLCSAGDIAAELARRPRLPGRTELAELVQLLADGCQSELEIWGCLHVLRAPGMPPFVQQRRITVAGERFALDAAYDDVLLAVEMDGAAWAWHGSRRQREDDIRRDALLATIGWQTLRFGYARMTSDAVGCQHDVRSTHAARRRLWWALRPGSHPGNPAPAHTVRGGGPPASR
jgi:very-short-patch-repair endonuclease